MSKNVTPRSTAACRREIISCLSFGGPYDQLIPIQPKSDGRYFEIPQPKFALLHCDYPQNCSLPFQRYGMSVSPAFPILPILCLILSNVLILCTI